MLNKHMNLAIVSTNRDKYSETFIHNHVKLIPAQVHFLFDGYLPKQYSTDKGLTAYAFKKENPRKWFNFSRQEEVHDEEQLIAALEDYLTENKIDLILCEYGPSGVAMLPVSKRTNVPLAVHFHGYDAYRHDILSSYGKQYADLFEHAKAVIGVSKHMCRQLEKLGCDPLKLHCLPYGIDTDIFYKKENARKDITFVACGRFVSKKAPQITIKAFAEVLKQLPGATMVMAGEGALLPECMELAEKLGITNAIDFKGALSQLQIAELYSMAHVFVQHSVTTADGDSEGTPLAVLESGAAGLPVIATRHGGITDVVMDGETGFLVNEGDVEAMAEKMLFLAQRPQAANNMGSLAAERIRAGYDLKKYTFDLWHLLQKSV